MAGECILFCFNRLPWAKVAPPKLGSPTSSTTQNLSFRPQGRRFWPSRSGGIPLQLRIPGLEFWGKQIPRSARDDNQSKCSPGSDAATAQRLEGFGQGGGSVAAAGGEVRGSGLDFVAFAGGKEEIGFDGMLTGIQLEVAAL